MEHSLNWRREEAKKQRLEIMTTSAISLWLPNPSAVLFSISRYSLSFSINF